MRTAFHPLALSVFRHWLQPVSRGQWLAVIITLLHLAGLPASQAQEQPPLSQAANYQTVPDLGGYWVSEKLDGVRGYWNGEALLFRSGTRIHAPDWFTGALPDTALDGELWLGRRRFDELSGVLRRLEPDDRAWREISFMIFDLPHSPLDFDQRLASLRRLITRVDVPWLRLIPQFRVNSEAALQAELERVIEMGGEGLMLHKGSSRYHAERSLDLMKLKPVYDAEAVVLAHLPGQGRLEGMLGSLLVETAEGIRFRLGTGFSDAERRAPPPVGSVVTYQYSGLTRRGVPRFARYLRIRQAF